MPPDNRIRSIPSIRHPRLMVTQNRDGSLIKRVSVVWKSGLNTLSVRPDDEGHPIQMLQDVTVKSDFIGQLEKFGTVLFVDTDGLIRSYEYPAQTEAEKKAEAKAAMAKSMNANRRSAPV